MTTTTTTTVRCNYCARKWTRGDMGGWRLDYIQSNDVATADHGYTMPGDQGYDFCSLACLLSWVSEQPGRDRR